MAGDSIQANPATLNHNLEGELVAVTGPLETAGPIGGDYYLRPGDYVQINRWVEMYAWVEEVERDDDGTDYYYELEWTDNPLPPEEFYWADGHENPPLEIRDETFTVESATVGQYQIDPGRIKLPRAKALSLSIQKVYEGPYRIAEDYIFEGEGTLAQPVLGDIRVSFTTVPANMMVTVFGRQTDNAITPFDYNDKIQLYRALAGERSQAIDQLNSEYKNLLWGFRILGLLIMWLGLNLLASPLTSLLRFAPRLEQIGNWAIRGLTFVLALVMATTVMLISAIVHNIWALLTVLLLAGGAIYLVAIKGR